MLARICNERAESTHSNLQLRSMFEVRSHTADACKNRVDVNEQGDSSYAVEQEGAIWRLVRRDDGDMPEEVVTSFQGILCKKDLPPFTERNM
jgi:hypothetical protein